MPRDPIAARHHVIELLRDATVEKVLPWAKIENGYGLNAVYFKVALRELGDLVELRLQRHTPFGGPVQAVGVIDSREFPELFTLWEHVTSAMEPVVGET